MKSEKKHYPGVNIGSASMLVIFIILCLVTFAVLSVASANKDYAYSQKNAGQAAAYQEAANKAETLLAEIDQLLQDAYLEKGSAYIEELPQTLQDIEELDTSLYPVIHFQIPVNENQALYVSLTVQVPQKEQDTLYTITSWQEIFTGEWEGDTSLNLM